MLEALFSSRVRARLLEKFFLSSGVAYNARALAVGLGERYSAVWRELVRLEKLGILTSQTHPNSKTYSVNLKSPIAAELRSIVLKTSGISKVIQSHLAEEGEIKAAFIYGSFASGEADAKSDLDLMVIGDVHLESFALCISQVEKALQRPVNYVIFTEAEWNKKIKEGDAFIMNVVQSPKIMLVGDENAL
ncbi:MAG: hypothetical protein HPY45_13685 [Anaerolineae bacterium]|nr:hypothetical protein [Anaerolineae bacterium]